MVAFDVFLNGERLCVAGVGEFGVLTACVTWVALAPAKLDRLKAEGALEQAQTELTLDVGGLRSDERASSLHMRWTDTPLRVGDEIRVRLTDAAEVDAAASEYVGGPDTDKEERKAYVRRVAKELGWEIRES
jgi:hypothetical protein